MELAIGIERQGGKKCLVIEVEKAGGFNHVPNEGRLTRLPRANDVNHTRCVQGAGDDFREVARNDIYESLPRKSATSYGQNWRLGGRKIAY